MYMATHKCTVKYAQPIFFSLSAVTKYVHAHKFVLCSTPIDSLTVTLWDTSAYE